MTDADLTGKWSVVFFYPADFTFVCPTELGDLADNYAEFQRLGVEIYSVSTDTHFTHKAWHDTSDTIGKIQYPMLGDPTGAHHPQLRRAASRSEGLADRGTFVVDPDGVIQFVEITRRRHRPQRRRAAPQGQGRPVRRARTRARSARPSGKRATTPSPRRSTSSARSDRARAAATAAMLDPPTLDSKAHMLDAALTAAQTHLDSSRADRARRLARRQRQVGRAARRCSTRSPRCPTGSPSCARDDDDARARRSRIDRVGTDVAVRFAGIPLGHEFTSLVLALLQVGGHPLEGRAET